MPQHQQHQNGTKKTDCWCHTHRENETIGTEMRTNRPAYQPTAPPQCSGLVGAEVEGDAPSPSLCSRLGPHESDYISDGQQPPMRLIRRSIGQLDTTIDWEAAAEGEGSP